MREAIEDVFIRYASAYDEQEVEAAAALFTEDGTLQVSTAGVPLAAGREAIAAFLGAARAARAARGEQPRHLVDNVRVVASDGETADVVSTMALVLTHADGSTTLDCAGTYTDRLVQRDGRWWFASRRIAFDRDRVAPATGPAA